MLYLPDFEASWTLSRWAGRPEGLAVDPIGVECIRLAKPERRRSWFARPPAAPEPEPYLHVLVHQDLPSDRIRSWAARQVAVLCALSADPDAAGDALNRATDAEAARLAGRDWVPAEVVLDGVAREASVFEAEPALWAAYLDLGQDRVALVGRDLTLPEARLRTATGDEARELRTAALRV